MVTTFAAVVGMVLGSAGFVMSLKMYLRDRVKVKVVLLRPSSWPAFTVMVANTGRRTTFISQTGIRAKEKITSNWHNIAKKNTDCSLSEGSAPIKHSFMLKDLPGFRTMSALQAFAVDSRGQMQVSKRLRKRDFPGQTKPEMAS